MHKSGFVNIIGMPNAGKSTLMNALMDENLSIITEKPQTTRHRILGISSTPEYQIVFSDTPGIIMEAKYKMQEKMNTFVDKAMSDADVLVYILDMDAREGAAVPEEIYEQLANADYPVILLLNKADLSDDETLKKEVEKWAEKLPEAAIIPVSALYNVNLDMVKEKIVELLPEGPAYYPKEQLSDRNMRFFVAEIIRKHILKQFHQEIPYSVEVVVNRYKDKEDMVRIAADIYTLRKSQKAIVIGKGGEAIKALGTSARKDLEEFLNKKVYLDLHVRVREKWRDSDMELKRFGYN